MVRVFNVKITVTCNDHTMTSWVGGECTEEVYTRRGQEMMMEDACEMLADRLFKVIKVREASE